MTGKQKNSKDKFDSQDIVQLSVVNLLGYLFYF